MKNFFRFSAIGFVFLLTVITLSSAGGLKEGSSGCKKGCPDNPPTITYKAAKLVLNPFTSLGLPPDRNPAYQPVPATPSLWSGGNSASGLYIDWGIYYCKITIATTDGTIKHITWKADNGTPNQMTIQIPDNTAFRLNVEYWEQCGPYWQSPPYQRRGLWMYESGQASYNAIITVNPSDWHFVRTEAC